jgi:hypothetical protein
VKRADWLKLSEALARPLPRQPKHPGAGSSLSYRSRVLAERLDEVCPGAWSMRFRSGAGRVVCELTIHGVTRSAESEVTAGLNPRAAAETLAFKRACAEFGLGREASLEVASGWLVKKARAA